MNPKGVQYLLLIYLLLRDHHHLYEYEHLLACSNVPNIHWKHSIIFIDDDKVHDGWLFKFEHFILKDTVTTTPNE